MTRANFAAELILIPSRLHRRDPTVPCSHLVSAGFSGMSSGNAVDAMGSMQASPHLAAHGYAVVRL